jgi:signal transduction histidine kinase
MSDETRPGAGPPPATERVLAGFCHDLNGQLTNAFGWLSLMGPGEEPGGGPTAHLNESLERMEGLLRELRWLVRESGRTPQPASLVDLLTAWESGLRQHPRFHDVEFVREGDGDLPAIRVDFASALRVLLLAADAAGVSESVSSVRVHTNLRDGRVRLGVSEVGRSTAPEGDSTLGAASRLALELEAREAGYAVEWDDGEVFVEFESIG